MIPNSEDIDLIYSTALKRQVARDVTSREAITTTKLVLLLCHSDTLSLFATPFISYTLTTYYTNYIPGHPFIILACILQVL